MRLASSRCSRACPRNPPSRSKSSRLESSDVSVRATWPRQCDTVRKSFRQGGRRAWRRGLRVRGEGVWGQAVGVGQRRLDAPQVSAVCAGDADDLRRHEEAFAAAIRAAPQKLLKMETRVAAASNVPANPLQPRATCCGFPFSPQAGFMVWTEDRNRRRAILDKFTVHPKIGSEILRTSNFWIWPVFCICDAAVPISAFSEPYDLRSLCCFPQQRNREGCQQVHRTAGD